MIFSLPLFDLLRLICHCLICLVHWSFCCVKHVGLVFLIIFHWVWGFLILHTCLAFVVFGSWRNEYQWECYISSSIKFFFFLFLVLNLNAEAIWNAKQRGNLFQMIMQTDIFETWMLKMNFIHFHNYMVFLSDLLKL